MLIQIMYFSTLALRVLDAKSFKEVKLCNSLLQALLPRMLIVANFEAVILPCHIENQQ
jgi:hypothetical protein